MSGMVQSAVQRKARELCKPIPTRTALHVPTNQQHRVILEIEGIGVELETMERRCIQITWAAWTNNEIWRLL